MHISKPKKMNILLILEVLKKYSDDNIKLTQKEIGDIVERDYDVPFDRHTLKRNLDNLYDFKCGVEYAERDSETGAQGGWYFERELTDAELRMLIDGLLFSKYIPYSECKELIKKLESIGSVNFKRSHNLPENRPENKQIFLNIEEILYAMSTRKKIAFHYMRYNIDKNAHVSLCREGRPRRYVINPYEIVITNGRYYLICATDKGDKLAHYRLDHICDVEVLKSENRRSIREITGYRNGLRLAEYMRERPYMMFSGDIKRVTIRLDKGTIGHVLDWFGNDVHFTEEANDMVKAVITVNEQAMFFWALQYGKFVEVLEPKSLRKQIHETITAMAKRYE